MAEPRLIDANAEAEWAMENLPEPHSGVIVQFLRECGTIDPNTLPIVQELRAQVKEQKEQLSHLEYWELDRKQVLKSAAGDRAAVNVMRKHCEKTIAELRAELKQVKKERDAALADLKCIASCGCCAYGCKNLEVDHCFDCGEKECRCRNCLGGDCWEWHGLVAENATAESEVEASERH